MYRTIIKNFSFLISAHIVYKLLSLFTFVLIARSLNVNNFGVLSFAISFVGFFLFVVDFGLSELLIKDVAGMIEQIGNRYIRASMGLKLILSIISYCLIIIGSTLFSGTEEIRFIILILGLSLIFDSFTSFFRCIFRLFEKMEFEAISLIAEAISKFGFIYIAIKFIGLSILNVIFILLLVSSIAFIFTMIITGKKFIKLGLSFDYRFYINLLKKSLPFALISSFGVINFKISIIIIYKMLNSIATGWYSAATRLIEPLLIIPFTAAIALFSTTSRMHKDQANLIIPLHKNSLKVLLLCSLIVLLLVNIFADKITFLLLGREYLGSVIPLRILSFSLIPFFIKFYLERFILIIGMPKIIYLSYLLGTLVTVIFSLILIKLVGSIGVAIALVSSEFIIVGYNFIALKIAYLNRLH